MKIDMSNLLLLATPLLFASVSAQVPGEGDKLGYNYCEEMHFSSPADKCVKVDTSFVNRTKEEGDCYTPKTNFSCFNAPCSALNEAYYLGLHAWMDNDGEHYLLNPQTHKASEGLLRRGWIGGLNKIWDFLKDMMVPDGKDPYKKVQDPRFYTEDQPTYLRSNLESKEVAVPKLCDPRAHLYCEYSFRAKVKDAGHKEHPNKATGHCQCHPLYAVEGETDLVRVDEGSGTFASKGSVTYKTCRGRLNVPCKFDRASAFLRGERPNDREAPFIRAPYLDGELESRCMNHAQCVPLNGTGEEEAFRRGEIWQGFGYNPILVDMMLLTATKICKCKAEDGYFPNDLHDCVKKETNA